MAFPLADIHIIIIFRKRKGCTLRDYRYFFFLRYSPFEDVPNPFIFYSFLFYIIIIIIIDSSLFECRSPYETREELLDAYNS